ncbi:unnamed protein product [Urochloa decumbens]|uniref:F-box domain-containing protein n=1 Tax=Urochloa decumbens TaxID=240449 RepID=A0ABC9D989_9POAL
MAPPPPPRRPPDLMEEIFEEVLLRFPPDDPASLVRAALVSKRWCRLIAGGRFRRRFRELHRAPPMLGFICNVFMKVRNVGRQHKARAWEDWLHPFVVWDPVTGEELQLPSLPMARCRSFPVSFNAAVLCAGGHLDGHFLVVFVGMYNDEMVAYEYSSEAGAWSEPTILQHLHEYVDLGPTAVMGNAVYFELGTRILKFDLGTRETSLIDMPFTPLERIILVTTDEGRLGFTMVDYNCKLYLWSMEVVGPGDDVGAIFVGTKDGFYTIDLKSNQTKKVGRGLACMKNSNEDIFYGRKYVVPYTSFLFPALEAVSATVGPGAGASGA